MLCVVFRHLALSQQLLSLYISYNPVDLKLIPTIYRFITFYRRLCEEKKKGKKLEHGSLDKYIEYSVVHNSDKMCKLFLLTVPA